MVEIDSYSYPEIAAARKIKFWNLVIENKKTGCWEWTGNINNYGYGRFQWGKKRELAHRLSYFWLVGDIPDDLQIDHVCRNRICVNPNHLRLLTSAENVLCGESPFAKKARQTHCIRGHELTGNNLRIRSDGRRACKACERMFGSKHRK